MPRNRAVIGEFEDGLALQPCENPITYWTAMVQEEIKRVIAKRGWAGLPAISRQVATVLALARPPIRNQYSAAKRLAAYRKNIADDMIRWRVWWCRGFTPASLAGR